MVLCFVSIDNTKHSIALLLVTDVLVYNLCYLYFLVKVDSGVLLYLV